MSESPDTMPCRGALLGLDPGERRVGLAICDPDHVVARPLMTLPGKWKRLASRIEELIEEHGVVGLVVGLPLLEDGRRGRQAQRAETLAFHLRRRWPDLPLALWDERWSSEAAQRRMAEAPETERAAGLDAAAAAVILQEYLSAQAPE